MEKEVKEGRRESEGNASTAKKTKIDAEAYFTRHNETLHWTHVRQLYIVAQVA